MDYDYYIPLPPPPPPPIVVAVEEPKVGVEVVESYIPLGVNNMTLPSLRPSVNPDIPISSLAMLQVNSETTRYGGNTFIHELSIPSVNQPSIIGVQPNPTYAGNTPIYAGNDAITNAVSQWSLYPAVSVVYASTISTNALFTNSLIANTANISTIRNSTIITTSINIDGQTLNADSDQLFLNGIPIATTAHLSSIADWAIYDAVSSVRMLNNDIVGARNIYATNLNSQNCSTINIQANYINTNFMRTNYASVSSIGGTYASFTDLDVSTIQFNTTVGVGQLSVNASASTLFFNGVPITTGTPIPGSNWSQYPAIQTVDMASNALNNVGSFTMPTSVYNNFNLGGGTVLTPISQNNQYALNTKIVNTSPLTPMEITSAGGMNITANATTGTQEFNISLVGANGNDLNITAPDINLTMTDPGSFMNLTAPGGVAILGGGGFFMASGVFEVITGLDVSLITAGNIRIGSGNVGGATTQIEKFEFTDCNVEPMNGVNNLRLINCQISNVRRDAGGAGIFPGDFRVKCEQETRFTIQSYNSNAQQTIWSVTADDGSNVSKAMTLTSLGSNQPIRFNMTANGNVFTTTYNSGNTVSYTTTGGDATLAGIGTINASAQLSAPTVSGTNGNFSNLNITSLNTINVSSATIGVSSIVGNYGLFHTLRTDASTIALGYGAGVSTGCITLNASGLPLNPVAPNSTYIKPLRNVSTQPAGTAFAMGYTNATGELVVANTKINEIESTIQNTQRISYNEGILTTTIDGLMTVNGNAEFTQAITAETTFNSLQIANLSSLTLNGIPLASYTNTLLYNSTTKNVSYFPTTSVIPTVAVSQNVFYVAKGGSDTTGNGQSYNPYLTIQKAIDMCPVGSQDVGQTIYIMPGLYVEDLSIADKNINFRGSGDTNQTYNTTIRGNMTITSSNTNRSYRTVSFQFVQIQNYKATTGVAITLSTSGTGKGKLILTSCYVIGASTGVSLLSAIASNCDWEITMDATRFYTGFAYSAPLIDISGASTTAVGLTMNNCLAEYESPSGSTNSIIKVSGYAGMTLQYCTITQPLNVSLNNSALTNGLIWVNNVPNSGVVATSTNGVIVGTTLCFSGTQATLGVNGTAAMFISRGCPSVYVLTGTMSVRSNSVAATHCIVGSTSAGTKTIVYYATGTLITTIGTANKIDNTNCTTTVLTPVSG